MGEMGSLVFSKSLISLTSPSAYALDIYPFYCFHHHSTLLSDFNHLFVELLTVMQIAQKKWKIPFVGGGGSGSLHPGDYPES